MSGAETRERAAAGPSETDIAFAKAVKTRRVGPDPKPGEDEVAKMPPKAADESDELAVLREQVAMLRSLVMSQRAPTNARRLGEVADAELAAEACSADLLVVIEEAKPRGKKDRNEEWTFAPEDHEKIQGLREKLKKLNQDVDIARALAGEISRDHPGLRHLPPEHPVFRMQPR